MHVPANSANMATRLNESLPNLDIPPQAIPSLSKADMLLDIGSGIHDSYLLEAILTHNKNSAPRVVRSDYFPQNLAGGSGDRVAANATALPFRAGVFQVVTSSEVTQDNPYFLFYEENRKRMGAEVARVLRVGGHYLVYHEVQNLATSDGIIKTVEHRGKQSLDANHTAEGVLFGAYRKIAEWVDTDKVGVNANMDGDFYEDEYLRELTVAYPVDQTIGCDRATRIAASDWKGLSELTANLLGNAEMEHELARKILWSVLAGKWRSQKSPVTEPDNYLKLLSERSRPRPHNNEGARDLSLWEMQRSPYFHVVSHEDYVVTMPTQKLMDAIVERVIKRDGHSQLFPLANEASL